MNDNIIRPRGSVTVPNATPTNPNMSINHQQQTNIGMGVPGQQVISPGDAIKNMLLSSIQTTQQGGRTGGLNWGKYDTNSYEDEALRSLMTPEDKAGNNAAYFVDRVAQAMQAFMQQIYHRNGQFFEEFKKAKEGFKFSTVTSLPCNVRKTFVDEVDKLHEFTRIMAIHGAPFFGYRLICILKETNKDGFTTADYLDSAHVAVRNVLFFEMIGWLSESRVGRTFADSIPKEISDRIANLQNFKDAAFTAFDTFGLPNPYAGTEYKRVVVTRPDYSLITQPVTTFVTGGDIFGASPSNSQYSSAEQELLEFMKTRGRNQNEPSYTQTRQPNPAQWNTDRRDFENLDSNNRHEFNLRKYFSNIGKPNHYFILETDWKAIKHGLNKHPEMGQEETAVPGTFRIVIINLDDPEGTWFSTLVRNERLELVTVLSDPSVLLSGLQTAEDLKEELLSIIETEKYVKDGDFVEIEEAILLSEKIPYISVSEKIKTNTSSGLETTILAVNKRLTDSFKGENATGFNATINDTFACSHPNDKIELKLTLPMLFTDLPVNENMSLLTCYTEILGVFKQGRLAGELMTLIDTKLTSDFNNYLVNCLGYDFDIKSPNHMSVDSILRDHIEITQIFSKTDSAALTMMTQSHFETTYLGNQLRMFEFGKEETASNNIIENIKDESSLLLTKHMFVNVINNRGGAIHNDPNVPVIIKRSRFPELFQMMEEGFKTTMIGHDYKTTDKIVYYADTENIWLFNHSHLDSNVATLRHVSRKKPLVFLAQD